MTKRGRAVKRKDEYRTGERKLRPKARLIQLLGEELISDDTVAIIELVKNSYDADATSVQVKFAGDVEKAESLVEIADDGVGMSLDTVLSGWFEPATTFRKGRRLSPSGRRTLGEKGIGRFAASRLGNFLEMTTKEAKAAAEIHVVFDWSVFETEDYLDQIECSWDERKPVEIKDHGTTLRISGLKRKWDRRDFEKLHVALSRLLSPMAEIEDFEIHLELPRPFSDLAGPVAREKLLSHPHYKIVGTVEADSSYRFQHVQDGKQEVIEGTFSDGDLPACGPFRIELRVWDRDRDSIEKLARIFDMKASRVRKTLDDAAGIHVYRDKFRVLPYGERGNDWLRLDHRRVQNPTLRVSNNQVMGIVSISGDSNPHLRDQTNREGIMAGPAFDALQRLVVGTLSLLETRRYKARRKPQPPPKGGIFEGFSLQAVRESVTEKYPGDTATVKVIKDQEEKLQAKIDTVMEVLARYRRLATLGYLVDMVLHEGRRSLSKIANAAKLGGRDLEKPEAGKSWLERLSRRFNLIMKQSGVLSTLFHRIEPFGGRRRGRPARTTIEAIVRDSFALFEAEMRGKHVKRSLPRSSTPVTVDPVELQQVFVNLLLNSMYWLSKLPEGEKREILVTVQRIGDSELEIFFCDSGPGVDEGIRDRIFEPYFSTKPDGVGLGLTIAGEIVAEYNGDLELIAPGLLPGACFRITLRKRVLG